MTTATAPRLAASPPGRHPIMGHAPLLLRERGGSPGFDALFAEHGDALRLQLGPRPIAQWMTLFRTPAAVRDLLGGQHGDGFAKAGYPVFDRISLLWGDGLLVTEGERWRAQRRAMQPLFTPRAVQAHATAIREALARRIAFRVACRVLFAVDSPTSADEMAAVFEEASAYLIRSSLSPLPTPRRVPIGWIGRGERATARLHDLVDQVIAEAGGGALVALLQEAVDPETGATPSAEDVRAQVLLFLLAGHETTSTAIATALHLLGLHPDVQADVAAEVGAAGIPDGPADLARLPLTTAVVHEAMRLYPPSHGTGRVATQARLVDGYEVGVGEAAFVSFLSLHRHPDLWTDPLTFSPQRFVDRPPDKRERFTYVPFGAGRRACIGGHLAMLEAVIALAVIVPSVQLRSRVREVGFRIDLTLTPDQPLPATVTARA